MNRNHGQMSLEMIVGLVILLVVAAVVISTFLGVFPSGKDSIPGQQTVSMQNIENSCQQKCNAWKSSSGINSMSAAVEYCTARFTYDSNDDGAVSQLTGQGYNSYCEDGVHCFNVYECSNNNYVTLNAERCREVLCNYYQNPDVVTETNQSAAGERIYNLFAPATAEGDTGIGTCNLPNRQGPAGADIRTWWSSNFETNDTDGTLQDGDYMYICRGIEGASGGGGGDDDDDDGGPPPPPS